MKNQKPEIPIIGSGIGGEPFNRLEDTIDSAKPVVISDGDRNTAGYSLEKIEGASR